MRDLAVHVVGYGAAAVMVVIVVAAFLGLVGAVRYRRGGRWDRAEDAALAERQAADAARWTEQDRKAWMIRNGMPAPESDS